VKRLVILIAVALAAPAAAQDLKLHGLAQARVVMPANEVSTIDGGVGRLRYGRGDAEDFDAELSDLFLEGALQATSSFKLRATLKRDPEQDEAVDLVEGFAEWKPVSTAPVRWALKAGAFFPPISLENDDIGWTSVYTMTPSAINSWVGEELRAIGGEARLDWRFSERSTLSVFFSAYGWNDPAGVLLDIRGWGMTDRVTGMADGVRLPDYFAAMVGEPTPFRYEEFAELDGRFGYYAGAEWSMRDGPRLRLLRYDNRADPAAIENGWRAWLTQFWSAGAEAPVGPWTFIAQGMSGHTDVDLPMFYRRMDFSSAFLLVGRDLGDVRLAGRVEFFRADATMDGVLQGPKEDGGAATLAATWSVNEHAVIRAEALTLDVDRPSADGASLRPGERETQAQLALQLRF